MNITEKQFAVLIATLASIEASGTINGKPVLGLSGAEEAFFAYQDFVSELEKPTNKKSAVEDDDCFGDERYYANE